MKVRAIKQRFSRVMGRHLMAPWRSRIAEDIAWDRMVPVGHEFGSPDIDRLMELDDARFSAFGSIERVRQWLDSPNDQFGASGTPHTLE